MTFALVMRAHCLKQHRRRDDCLVVVDMKLKPLFSSVCVCVFACVCVCVCVCVCARVKAR